MADEKDLRHQMQPEESLIPDNNDQKDQEAREEADNGNRMTMSGPSMRPNPQTKSQLTPAQIEAEQAQKQRSQQLTQQMIVQQTTRQNWINKPNLMQRVQNTLAKDPALRNAVFTVVKGGAIVFKSLKPEVRSRVAKNVKKQLRVMARNAENAMKNLNIDPNDPTHPLNQANPSNLANQWQAIQQGIVTDQDNLQAQENLIQDNQVAQTQQKQAVSTENKSASMILTAEATDELAAHNQEKHASTPEPKPGAQADDETIKEAKEATVQDSAARTLLEHRGEKEALQTVMGNAKDAVKKVTKIAEDAALKVGMSLMSR